MVEHWMAGVEAGRNILWDAMGQAMGQNAEDVMGEYDKSLKDAEQRIEKNLNAQVEVLKQDKEAIIAAAASVFTGIEAEARNLSAAQQEALGQNRDVGICHSQLGTRADFTGSVFDPAFDPKNDSAFVEWGKRTPLNMPECLPCPCCT
ncbi:MAG: hypothetical protein LBB48_05365 [Treponema sp.]|jgi:hypothetical protein|nr:hypothetical protein [Treponema sp.]